MQSPKNDTIIREQYEKKLIEAFRQFWHDSHDELQTYDAGNNQTFNAIEHFAERYSFDLRDKLAEASLLIAQEKENDLIESKKAIMRKRGCRYTSTNQLQ